MPAKTITEKEILAEEEELLKLARVLHVQMGQENLWHEKAYNTASEILKRKEDLHARVQKRKSLSEAHKDKRHSKRQELERAAAAPTAAADPPKPLAIQNESFLALKDGDPPASSSSSSASTAQAEHTPKL